MENINKIARELGLAIKDGDTEKEKELRQIYEELKEKEKKEKKEEVKKFNQELLGKCIKKEDLENCTWYKGYRFRGDGIAKWDADKNCFLTINYTMGDYFLEEINHFEDEVQTRIDGFAPFEKIEK